MRVFVTGASGWVGTPTVAALVAAGHDVTGLARSDGAAAKIEAAGAKVLRGTIEDYDLLAEAAAAADGVIHTAFIHDFAHFAENCAIDGKAIAAMVDALSGTGKPFIATSGTGVLQTSELATEEMMAPENTGFPRISEKASFAGLDKNVRAMIVRLPPTTHGRGDHGFTPWLINIAREKGHAAYVGDGGNCWAAGHRLDAAKVFTLALEKGEAGDRFHAVAETGIAMRDLASAIGKGLGVPVKSISAEEAEAYYGMFTHFAMMNSRASSALTRAKLGWQPVEKTLLSDLAEDYYFTT
ncbi:SDR family oxidoreductase [Martelella sp. HB161492]|uniref:SDR family oxidoreductase n=1 Tax=Martelella sp. HB161492 TaxID=2720726 RepID=UPI0015912962|nr:SDR family oxidoreductase [Martelella sp. HB161492]